LARSVKALRAFFYFPENNVKCPAASLAWQENWYRLKGIAQTDNGTTLGEALSKRHALIGINEGEAIALRKILERAPRMRCFCSGETCCDSSMRWCGPFNERGRSAGDEGATMDEKKPRHPNSLANLMPPVRPGEVRNPLGINGRTYSLEYQKLSQEPIPEAVRLVLNKKFGAELIMADDTWARANAVAQHYEAVCRGLTSAAQELRESVEGRATQRIELAGADGVAAEHPTFRVTFEEEVLELKSGDERITPDDLSGK